MNWTPWSDRNLEFAPVVALHPHEPFYPVSVDTFLKEDSQFMVLVGTNNKGPVFGAVDKYDNLSFFKRCQLMMLPDFRQLFPHLVLHKNKRNMKKSVVLQKKYPTRMVYTRGFRNTKTKEAFITYWFFYVENFQPDNSDESVIKKELGSNSGVWWTHQGDWEGISVHFSDFEKDPWDVYFSQHTSYEIISWDNVMKKDNRVLALVALGSHATYNGEFDRPHAVAFREVTQLDPDFEYYPSLNPVSKGEYLLEELNPANDLWLCFDGRWGKSGGWATRAPKGPLMKDKSGFALKADIDKYRRK